MNIDKQTLETIEKIVFHSKCIAILNDPELNAAQAQAMIAQLYIQHGYEYDGTSATKPKSDTQELIDDDNRQRARDMNAVNRSYT